ncbi:MAG TPA: hypothetical protein VJB98_03985 [Candidatus Paceibacterota bacterium]
MKDAHWLNIVTLAADPKVFEGLLLDVKKLREQADRVAELEVACAKDHIAKSGIEGLAREWETRSMEAHGSIHEHLKATGRAFATAARELRALIGK